MQEVLAWRFVDPRVVVVEPTHGDGSPGHRFVSAPGLVRPVVDRFAAAGMQWRPDCSVEIVIPTGDGPALLTGRWRRDDDHTTVSAAAPAPGGSWRTVDGHVTDDTLHAVVADGFTATLAHLTVDLVAGPPLDVPLEPSDGAGGLPNACPTCALDVDFPVYEIELSPGAAFDGARPHRAALHLVASADACGNRKFALSLISREVLPGSLHLSGEGLRRNEHVQGSRIVVRWSNALGEWPRWLDGERPLDLAELELTIDFDPATHRVTGSVRGCRTAGGPVDATFAGALHAREVQQLRERLTLLDCSGSWIDSVGGAVTAAVDVRCAPQPEPPVVDLPSGRLRYVPALELLAGLRGPARSPELVVWRRVTPVALDLPDDPEARQALRLLGQDLCCAGRVVQSRLVLDHAARLIELAEAGPMPGAGESEGISLVLLLNWQVRCAFLLRDYGGLLGHLERAVALRSDLSAERHARARTSTIGTTVEHATVLVDGVVGVARAFRDVAARAGHPVESLAAVLVGLLDDAGTTLAGVAATLTTERELAAVVDAVKTTMAPAIEDLTAASGRSLDDPEGLFVDIAELVEERRRIVDMVDGAVGLRPAELGAWERREQDLERTVRARLPAPAAELFLLQRDTATTLRTAANLLAVSRSYLERADLVAAWEQRQRDSRAAATGLSEYVEHWRRRIADDAQRIVAVNEAGSFYERLVGMLLDLDGPEEAWLASELARARATADLLGLGPDEELQVDALRRAVATLGRTVVEYFLRADELVVWIVPPDGPVHCLRRPGHASLVTAQVTRVRELAALRSPEPADRAELTATLRLLGALLWDPVADLVETGAPVSVVPHRELGLVPFGGLVTADGRPLLDHHTLTVMPAVSLVPALVRRGGTGAFGGPLLALVDPEPMPGDGLHQLRETRDSFHVVAALFATAEQAVWTGREATLERLTAPARAPAVVVLATHAEATDAGVFVALAPTATHDGRVRPAELVDLRLPGSTVVLSACHTGGGRVGHEGVDGLSRAFLVGGANILLMTLHEVVEGVALELAYQFLVNWRRGDPVDVAFRAAQLDLAAQHPDDPALWTPFAIFGLGGSHPTTRGSAAS